MTLAFPHKAQKLLSIQVLFPTSKLLINMGYFIITQRKRQRYILSYSFTDKKPKHKEKCKAENKDLLFPLWSHAIPYLSPYKEREQEESLSLGSTACKCFWWRKKRNRISIPKPKKETRFFPQLTVMPYCQMLKLYRKSIFNPLRNKQTNEIYLQEVCTYRLIINSECFYHVFQAVL